MKVDRDRLFELVERYGRDYLRDESREYHWTSIEELLDEAERVPASGVTRSDGGS